MRRRIYNQSSNKWSFVCWTSCMDIMRTGLPWISSSGWYMALLVVSVVCYIAAFSFSGLLLHWFTTSGHDSGLDLFFIVVTLMLVFVFAIVALHPSTQRSTVACSCLLRLLLSTAPIYATIDFPASQGIMNA